MQRIDRQIAAAARSPLGGLERERNDYRAAKRSTRLRPRPKGIPGDGAPADYHLRNDSDHLWVGELGMEMDRNNPIGERILDYQEKNVLQDGFQYDPQTGDDKLNADLKAWWTEHSEDPSKIDAQAQFGFNRLTRFVYRGMKAAGDMWGLLRSDGSIELAEFYRVRSPSRHVKEPIVLGVEMDGFRRRKQAWFTKDIIPAMSRAPIAKGDLVPFPFYHTDDELADERPRVLQVFDPDRCTMTRGLSAFKTVFDYLGMHEDQQFLMLLKSQMANMVLLLRERSGVGFQPEWLANTPNDGAAAPNIQALAQQLLAQEMRPGMQLGGLPGETLKLDSANIPNAEFFQHMKFVLAICGLPFSVALVCLLLDAGETNFSGFRGAQNEARLMMRVEQGDLALQWHQPILWFNLDKLAEQDAAIAKARDGKYGRNKVNLYRHRWKMPRWPYIQPVEDATAALIRRANTLTSTRRQCIEDGVGDWDEIYVEQVDDIFAGDDYALKRAAELVKKHALDSGLDNRGKVALLMQIAARFLPLPNPERTQISLSANLAPEQAAAAPKKSGGKDE
jgi:capsid protein